jgi:hypothetical protein
VPSAARRHRAAEEEEATVKRHLDMRDSDAYVVPRVRPRYVCGLVDETSAVLVGAATTI